MKRRRCCVFLILACVTAVLTASATWRGKYLANPTLTGHPAKVRFDGDIAFSWALGAPAPTAPVDGFSVGRNRAIYLPTLDGGSMSPWTTACGDVIVSQGNGPPEE